MSNNSQNSGFWFLVLCFIGFAMFLQAITGGSSNSAPSSSSSSSDNSFERRYTEQRFRQEGYSSKDAATAADAVIKFQRAQEARRNR